MNPQDARNARELEEPASEVDAVASAVLKAAVEVHRVLGPGFFEGVYEQALCLELMLGRIPFVRQPAMAIVYKDHLVGEVRPDLLVAQRLIIELPDRRPARSDPPCPRRLHTTRRSAHAVS